MTHESDWSFAALAVRQTSSGRQCGQCGQCCQRGLPRLTVHRRSQTKFEAAVTFNCHLLLQPGCVVAKESVSGTSNASQHALHTLVSARRPTSPRKARHCLVWHCLAPSPSGSAAGSIPKSQVCHTTASIGASGQIVQCGPASVGD